MGAADVVPGVSGGTVALLTGIYDRLIGNIGIGSPPSVDWSEPTSAGRSVNWAESSGASLSPSGSAC
ncbi:MAG: hypothetical protein CM1200mP26_27210 [Acidimicrobiales bacterium]|nr:MAG: hypothetical protein CM1200mP26_27210 [Acidimicrobiales bacterium]